MTRLSSHVNLPPIAPALVLLILALALAGCATPNDSLDQDVEADSGTAVPWQLQAQRSLGHYERFQAPFASLSKPHPDYCPELHLDVPAGTTHLGLSLAYEASQDANGTFGVLMGYSAQSPSHDTWVDYPGTFDQHRWLDNPKALSFDNPETGTWRIYTYTMGASLKQLGNLTIDVQGTSAEVPQELGIEMKC